MCECVCACAHAQQEKSTVGEKLRKCDITEKSKITLEKGIITI